MELRRLLKGGGAAARSGTAAPPVPAALPRATSRVDSRTLRRCRRAARARAALAGLARPVSRSRGSGPSRSLVGLHARSVPEPRPQPQARTRSPHPTIGRSSSGDACSLARNSWAMRQDRTSPSLGARTGRGRGGSCSRGLPKSAAAASVREADIERRARLPQSGCNESLRCCEVLPLDAVSAEDPQNLVAQVHRDPMRARCPVAQIGDLLVQHAVHQRGGCVVGAGEGLVLAGLYRDSALQRLHSGILATASASRYSCLKGVGR